MICSPKTTFLRHGPLWAMTGLSDCRAVVCIFSNGAAVESSVHDYLLFTHQRWINTDDLTLVCAYTSMCMYLLLHRKLGLETQHISDPD